MDDDCSSTSPHGGTVACVPGTQTVYNDPCKQKALYVARQSVSASTDTRVVMAAGVLGFSALLFAMGVSQGCRMEVVGDRRLTLRSRASYSFVGTLFLVSTVMCTLTYALTVQHEFYCEEVPKWERWNSEWVIAGFVPGWATAIAFANWVYLLYNDVAGRRHGDRSGIKYCFGAWVLGIPLATAVLPVLLIFALLYGLLMSAWTATWKPMTELLANFRVRHLGQRKGKVQPGDAAAQDVELAAVAAAGNEGSGQEQTAGIPVPSWSNGEPVAPPPAYSEWWRN